MAEEESEDENASRREDRFWGCGGDLVGCGCQGMLGLAIIPLVLFFFWL